MQSRNEKEDNGEDMFTFDQFTLEVTPLLHSYSMATFCHADKHRGKEARRNDLAVNQEERNQVCQYLALSLLSKFTKVFELLVTRCLAALTSSRIETISAPN